MSTQRSPGPIHSLLRKKLVLLLRNQPANQNPPWLSPPSTLRELLPQWLPRQPFHLEIDLAEEVTGLSRHGNNEYQTWNRPIRMQDSIRQWTVGFWSCPVHSTKNRIRRPQWWVGVCGVCVCVCVGVWVCVWSVCVWVGVCVGVGGVCVCSVFLNRLSTSWLINLLH